MTNLFNKLSTHNIFSKIILAAGFVIILLSLASVSAHAQEGSCRGGFETGSIKWWDIAQPTKFLPIVPNSCTLDADGEVKALPLSLIPAMFVRAYGLIVSFAFYLITPVLIGSGLMYMYGGIDSSQVGNAKKWLINSAIGFVLIISFYFIIFLALGFLDPEGNITGADLSEFI